MPLIRPFAAPSLGGRRYGRNRLIPPSDASLRRVAPDLTDLPTYCPLYKGQAAPHANLAGALG
jgi:hypothetical protein